MQWNMFLAGKILFGSGVSSLAGEKAKALGGSRALLVTDGTMLRLGIADRIAENLRAAGCAVSVFSDVEPEPSVETVDRAAAIARAEGSDIVVGLGGGSCLDAAKAVSVLATNEGSAAAYQGLGLVTKPGVPKIMIPTTAGTGSEVTFTAVLIRRSDGVKGGINGDYLYPDCSLLDPDLTLSMPPSVTASTGMDALAHSLEAFTSRQASPFSDMFAREAIRRIGKHLRVATFNGKDREARENMMLAALFGGVALASAGVTACHALAYPLGGMFGVAHGVSNALLLSHVARFNAFASPERFAEAAALLGGDTYDLPERDGALLCADLIGELVADLGLPRTLRDLGAGIAKERFATMAAKAMGVARPIANNPRDICEKDCIAIYEEVF